MGTPIKQWAEKKAKPAGRSSTALLKAYDKIMTNFMLSKDKPAFKKANLAKLKEIRADIAQSDDPGANWMLDVEIARWEKA